MKTNTSERTSEREFLEQLVKTEGTASCAGYYCRPNACPIKYYSVEKEREITTLGIQQSMWQRQELDILAQDH
jgi:hypothetical protein